MCASGHVCVGRFASFYWISFQHCMRLPVTIHITVWIGPCRFPQNYWDTQQAIISVPFEPKISSLRTFGNIPLQEIMRKKKQNTFTFVNNVAHSTSCVYSFLFSSKNMKLNEKNKLFAHVCFIKSVMSSYGAR